MHARSIPVFTGFLSALDKMLVKAEAHCEETGIAPEALLDFRLFPDMFSFTRQVQLACDFASRGCDRLGGREFRSYPDTETGFAELRARIATVQEYLAGFTTDEFAGAETRIIPLKVRGADMPMPGELFLEGYSKPQFFFHLTTAYNVLRHNGVAVGKLDYMGAA